MIKPTKFRALTISADSKSTDSLNDADNCDLSLDVTYYTSQDGCNLNQIIGSVNFYSTASLSDEKSIKQIDCGVTADELYRLPLSIKGLDVSLVDRAKYKIKTRGRGDNVDVFINGYASTIVQFKLWGKLFKDSPCPITEIKPEMFSAAIFAEVQKQAAKNSTMNKWTAPMIQFWDKWKFMFEQECSCADRVDQLEAKLNLANQEMSRLNGLVNQLQLTINSIRMIPTFRC
jgi:hypothetical protein